ncbi:hypothetical protein T484DRAFT_1802730, partial [Baffinella frigidus]
GQHHAVDRTYADLVYHTPSPSSSSEGQVAKPHAEGHSADPHSSGQATAPDALGGAPRAPTRRPPVLVVGGLVGWGGPTPGRPSAPTPSGFTPYGGLPSWEEKGVPSHIRRTRSNDSASEDVRPRPSLENPCSSSSSSETLYRTLSGTPSLIKVRLEAGGALDGPVSGSREGLEGVRRYMHVDTPLARRGVPGPSAGNSFSAGNPPETDAGHKDLEWLRPPSGSSVETPSERTLPPPPTAPRAQERSPRTTSARPAGKRSRGDYFFMVKSQLSGEGEEVVKHDAVDSDAEHGGAPRVVPIPNATFGGGTSSADSRLTSSVGAVLAGAALPSTPLAASDGVDTTIKSFLDLRAAAAGRAAPSPRHAAAATGPLDLQERSSSPSSSSASSGPPGDGSGPVSYSAYPALGSPVGALTPGRRLSVSGGAFGARSSLGSPSRSPQAEPLGVPNRRRRHSMEAGAAGAAGAPASPSAAQKWEHDVWLEEKLLVVTPRGVDGVGEVGAC